MEASKENCSYALMILADQAALTQEETHNFLKEFLEAAYKRLPTEAAINKDKERRNSRKGK